MSALLELLKAKNKDMAAAAGNHKKTIKPFPGHGRYRILPSWRGEGQQFWHDFGQHFIKKDGVIAAIYMCTDKTYGRPCGVCQAIEHGIKGASDDHTMEMLKGAKANGRILVNAIHVDKTPNQVDILELSPTAFAQVIKIAQEWEEAGESLFDAVRGKDFLIERTGTGLQTKYTVQVSAKTAPLPVGALEMLNDLDAYVQQESEAASVRALNAVRSVAGLLPAPLAAGAAPSSTEGAARFEEDPYEAAPMPPKRAVAPATVADVSDAVAKLPVKPKGLAALASIAAVVAADSTGDNELDDLLASLG